MKKHKNSYLYKACDHPPTYVLSIDDCHLYAAKSFDVPSLIPSTKIDKEKGFDLVLNCTNMVSKSMDKEHEYPKELKDLFQLPYMRIWEPVQEINFDMPDGSAPWELTIEFWQELIRRYKDKKILIFCQGGHGRTGTVLGAFLAASGCLDVANLVRLYHCKEAIESDSQEKYLTYLEGIWAERCEIGSHRVNSFPHKE